MNLNLMNIKYSILQYAFFGFNILFWITGCGSLAVGIWLYVVKTEYLSLAPAAYGALSAAGLCIAAGATVIVIGFVGCCGAWIESRCLLLTYFIFVFLIFCVEIVATVLGFLYRNEVTEVVHNELLGHINEPFVSEKERASSGSRITWDLMQRQFECCGVDGHEDWYRNSRWPRSDWVPDSCCDPSQFSGTGEAMENCGKIANPKLWFQKGCYQAFSNWLLEHVHIVGVLGLLLAIIQVFGLVASMIIYWRLKRSSTVYRQVAVPLQ